MAATPRRAASKAGRSAPTVSSRSEERGQAPPAAFLRRLIAARPRLWATQWYANRWWFSAHQRARSLARTLRTTPVRHHHRLHTNHSATPTAPHAICGGRRSHARHGGALGAGGKAPQPVPPRSTVARMGLGSGALHRVAAGSVQVCTWHVGHRAQGANEGPSRVCTRVCVKGVNWGRYSWAGRLPQAPHRAPPPRARGAPSRRPSACKRDLRALPASHNHAAPAATRSASFLSNSYTPRPLPTRRSCETNSATCLTDLTWVWGDGV